MAYVVIAATDYDPDSPITTTLAGAWSNNLAEAFAGNASFKIVTAALDTGEQMTAANVGTATASIGNVDIGSYIYSQYTGADTTVSFGESKPYTEILSATIGTWKSLTDTNTGAPGSMFLWKRVS